jgi:hypothetical protein
VGTPEKEEGLMRVNASFHFISLAHGIKEERISSLAEVAGRMNICVGKYTNSP